MNFYKTVYFDKAAWQKRKTLCDLMNIVHIIQKLTGYTAFLFLIYGNLLISCKCKMKAFCIGKSGEKTGKRIICMCSCKICINICRAAGIRYAQPESKQKERAGAKAPARPLGRTEKNIQCLPSSLFCLAASQRAAQLEQSLNVYSSQLGESG